MRKLFYTILTLLLCVGFVYAGLNDRHSKIDLTEDSQVSIPSTTPSTGDPVGGKGWVYVIDNYGELKAVFEDPRGNITVLGPKSVDLPLADWTRVWTGSETGVNNSIGWASSGASTIDTSDGYDYPYRVSNAATSAIVYQQFHGLDRRILGGQFGGHDPASNEAEDTTMPSDIAWYLDYSANAPITPIQTTFRIPSNYQTGDGLSVRLIVHQDPLARDSGGEPTTTARVAIGYSFIGGSDIPGHLSEASYGYDPILVGTVGHFLTPVEVILPYRPSATGSGLVSDLHPGQLMTVQVWRIRDLWVVDDLRILKARAQFTEVFD